MSTEISPSTELSIITTDKGVDLVGNLTFSTVSSVLAEGYKLLESHQADAVNINLADVKKIDSAGITLLLEWKRSCDKNNKNYQVVGAQEQLVSLITTNKMQSILNLK